MNHSILIADDSLTIQKVIRITLSGESYNLSDCDNSNKLFEIVEEAKPSLILLDFTLDEGVSGYDICKKIQRISPETRVMIMYGTFDSIDDELFQASGAAGKITKPFDGQKFITMCHQILEDQEFYGVTADDSPLAAIEDELSGQDKVEDGASAISALSLISPEEEIQDGILDEVEIETKADINTGGIEDVIENEWSLNDDDIELEQDTQNTLNNTKIDTEDDESFNFQSMISDELNEWGMSVPPEIITAENNNLEILDEVKEKVSEIAAVADLSSVEEDEQVEESIDLNFTNLVETPVEIEPVKLEIVPEGLEEQPATKVNLDGELEAKELIDFDLDNNEDKFSALETQLASEVSDLSESDEIDSLWKVDEPSLIDDTVEQVEEEAVVAVEESIKEDLVASDESLDSEVKQAVHEYMKKYGRGIIEKVAWEMIPDMAENIIREEVKNMAEKVLAKD